MDIAHLPKDQRIKVAQLSGTAERYAAGRGEGDPVAALHEITTDPALLGAAAASYLVICEREPRNVHAPAALRFLKEAGADLAALAEEAERVRYRLSQPTHEAPR
jgi:hypothetical protein